MSFFMVAMAVSLSLTWLWERRIAIMPLITGIFVFVFGALTLYLQDETFIKMKPTLVNLLFGTALLAGLLIFKRPLMKLLFDGPFRLDDEGWTKLTFRWGLFFFFLAADDKNCRCTQYDLRHVLVPDCISLSAGSVPKLRWLPKTCAYRRLAEGKRLPQWHPLISGNPESVIDAGISIRHRAVSETLVHPDDVDNFRVKGEKRFW